MRNTYVIFKEFTKYRYILTSPYPYFYREERYDEEDKYWRLSSYYYSRTSLSNIKGAIDITNFPELYHCPVKVKYNA